MKVLDLMNNNLDWEEILSNPPYSITIKRDDGYILLKYNQFLSDFSNPIVRECRGSIFYLRDDGLYECICRAFDKFGNYGEGYTDEIDWSTAQVQEKVDGSLIKVFYHNNTWHIATNGTINAYNCIVYKEDKETNKTYGSIFNFALRGHLNQFFESLDKDYTYMFELVSPYTRLVVEYPDTALYYLSRRNIHTMKEDNAQPEAFGDFGILFPKTYSLKTLEDCLAYVKTMDKNEEGFVVKDASFHRIKIKSPEYLLAFRSKNNGVLSTKRIIKMIREESIDDLLAYCPEYKERVDGVINKYKILIHSFEEEYQRFIIMHPHKWETLDRKDFAALVSSSWAKDFLFKKRGDPELRAEDYINSLSIARLISLLDEIKI